MSTIIPFDLGQTVYVVTEHMAGSNTKEVVIGHDHMGAITRPEITYVYNKEIDTRKFSLEMLKSYDLNEIFKTYAEADLFRSGALKQDTMGKEMVFNFNEIPTYSVISDKQRKAIATIERRTGKVFQGNDRADASEFISAYVDTVGEQISPLYDGDLRRQYRKEQYEYAADDDACSIMGYDQSDFH